MKVVPLEALQRTVTASDALVAVTEALRAVGQGKCANPRPMHLEVAAHQPQDRGEVHIKAASLLGASTWAVKIASGFYGNPQKTPPLPTSQGAVLVGCAQSGRSLALLCDDGWLTDLRTAAAGALAASWCLDVSNKSTRIDVAVLGAGVQARMQLEALATRLAQLQGPYLGSVKVWSRRPEATDAFCKECRFKAAAASTAEDACAGAALIYCCTPSQLPILSEAAWLRAGATVIAVGADSVGKRELGHSVVTTAKAVLCDSIAQCASIGELQYHSKEYLDGAKLVEMSFLASQDSPPGFLRKSFGADALLVADLTGLGAEDAALADMAYRRITGAARL